MPVLAIMQSLNLALFLAALGLELFALVDALTRPARAFEATGKMTKQAWLLILGLALVSILLFRSPMGLLGLLGVVAAGVYLADVRPALRGRR